MVQDVELLARGEGGGGRAELNPELFNVGPQSERRQKGSLTMADEGGDPQVRQDETERLVRKKEKL